MIDMKADKKGCLIREMTGSEVEIISNITAGSISALNMLFQQANTSEKNKKIAIKSFISLLADEFLK